MALAKYFKLHEKELETQTSLILNDKNLVGSVPSSISSYTQLKEINLNNNQLKGKIPPNLKALVNLEILRLNQNKFASKFPDIFNSLVNLKEIDLSDNKFSGNLPSTIGKLSNLTDLHIHKNKFSGPLPESFENLTSLVNLSLDSVIFKDGVPDYLDKFSNLKKLRIYKSQASEEVPIGNLSNLQILGVIELIDPEATSKDAPKEKEGKDKKKGKKDEDKIELIETPPGEKKDTSSSFPTSYHPKYVESSWYQWWEKQGFFRPEYNKDATERFSIVIPPPNVTGYLHLGHALANSIEDAIVRWNRMNGKKVLWVPGIDHAGIATQAVVEKKVWVQEKKRKSDFTREEFVEKIWEWKRQYGQNITNQLRRLGTSLDWSREVFTMDENLSKAVIEAFVRLYEKGKITRRERLVNWCCALHTAISDIEVDSIEVPEPTFMSVPGYTNKVKFGCLWEFAYKVEGSDEEIIVATTRPETMLGDTAVAIHPEDPRYKHLHGKYLVHPFSDRKIPIVTDDILVDMSFGTGAVKITPAHDLNDYECGKRHNLPFITVISTEGLIINDQSKKFEGMKRFDARKAVVDELTKLGLFKGEKPNPMRLSVCSRSGDVIEPLLQPQWYVVYKEMADKALEVVRSGELKIVPPAFTTTWYNWLENIQDWCISRQLWWGHRIPAYLVHLDGQGRSDGMNKEMWVVARTEQEAMEKAKEKFNTDKFTLEQDPDVLDTWFSSGLFPFSVMGWPEDTPDLREFYPNNILETGHDILFFWVARMVMMGLELTGKLPFNLVYLHAMVRDAHGRKMSKATGNVIDPIDVIEGIEQSKLIDKLKVGNLAQSEIETATKGIKKDFPKGISECGTDALRFALCAYSSQERDINLDILRVFGFRKFCNKIWNATKLSYKILGDYKPRSRSGPIDNISQFDQWILSRLNNAVKLTNEGFREYNFSGATSAIHSFFLYEFCDYYLEAIKYYFPEEDVNNTIDIKKNIFEKIELRKQKDSTDLEAIKEVIYTCLDETLRLLHPFMPFITEELWQRLPRRESEQSIPSICVSRYPVDIEVRSNSTIDTQFEEVKSAIGLARKAVSKGRVTEIFVKTEELKALFEEYYEIILILTFSIDLKITLKDSIDIDFDVVVTDQ